MAAYSSANKSDNSNAKGIELGFKYEIAFAPKVIFCGGTSAELLLEAICAGTIFLDPAPKLMANDRSKNKRRCQWRVNNINKAVHALMKTSNFGI